MKKILALLLVAISFNAYADPVTAQFMPNAIMRWSTGGTVVSLQDLRAFANIAGGTTDGAVIAAVTGKKIRVLAAVITGGNAATTVTFTTKPSGAGTAISSLISMAANSGYPLAFNPAGWFETNSGEGLSATTGAGSAVGISVSYVAY